MSTETRQSVIFWSSLCAAIISFIGMCALIVADTYVRWTLNQDFTFLGDFGLLALAVVFTGLMVSLNLTYRHAR